MQQVPADINLIQVSGCQEAQLHGSQARHSKFSSTAADTARATVLAKAPRLPAYAFNAYADADLLDFGCSYKALDTRHVGERSPACTY